MKRLAFLALLLGTAFLLTACPLDVLEPPSPPPPPSSICPPTPAGTLSAQALPQARGLGDFSAPHVPGELLVLSGGLSPQSLALRVQGAEVRGVLDGGFLQVKVPPGQEKAKAEALLRAGVRWAQPNYLYRPIVTLNDPLYPANSLDPSRLQPYYQAIRLEAAWRSLGVPLCSPVVAVLDTAFNLSHPDLRTNVSSGRNLTPDGLAAWDLSPSPPPPGLSHTTGEPDHGQGVAGLVAATANNYQGIPGAGLNLVRVLPLKVFYWTTGGYGSTSDVLATAIRYAADRGAVVVNLSLGSPTPMDVVVEEAITYALSRGTLVVAASGNEGRNGLYYPAAYPGVLVVGSAKLDGTRSDFSNYSTTPADLVLAAGGNRSPAQTLWSLALGQDYPYYQSLGPYAQWAGTSFAAPQASALAGLYVAKHYTLYGRSPTPDQIRLCLTQTASNGGNYDPQTGYGLLRADRVMADTRYCFP